MIELVEQRQENSKQFRLGDGGIQHQYSIGAIHYKDDYKDSKEQWKDNDLTWVGNRVNTAPFDLVLEGAKLTIRNKRDDSISSIEILEVGGASFSNKPVWRLEEGLAEYGNVRIILSSDTVKVAYIIRSPKDSHEAKYRVSGNIVSRARDDDGLKVPVEVTQVGDVITETAKPPVDAKYPIILDPTYEPGANTDMALWIVSMSNWSNTPTNFAGGSAALNNDGYTSGVRFLNVTIPNGSTIDSAKLVIKAKGNRPNVIVRTYLSCEDVDDAPTFVDNSGVFLARLAGSTAKLNWDGIGAWTDQTDYDSISIVAPVQTVINRPGWASGNAIVVFWEDFDRRSDDGALRTGYGWQDTPGKTPDLVITFSTPPVNPPERVSIVVRVAFTTAPFASTPAWTDISNTVLRCSVRRGRNHELDRMEAGWAVVQLLNVAGDYWPYNTAGAYTPNVLPAKKINIRASIGGTTYDIYTGFIENWQPGFINQPTNIPIMTLQCADFIKNTSRLLLNNTTGYVVEASGTRVQNVLSDLGWPTSAINLDAGQSQLQATGALVNENSQDHSFKVQDSEPGIVYLSPSGDAIYEDRHHRLGDGHVTSSGVFGDTPGELGYHKLHLAYDDWFIYNDVRMQREGGSEHISTSTTSQDAYGKRSLSRTGLLNNSDTDTESQAAYLKTKYENPLMRASELEIRPDIDPANLYPLALGLDISGRITVSHTASSLDEDYYIEGINHDWMEGKPWMTRWQLSKAEAYEYWRLGETGYSELGSTTRPFY